VTDLPIVTVTFAIAELPLPAQVTEQVVVASERP